MWQNSLRILIENLMCGEVVVVTELEEIFHIFNHMNREQLSSVLYNTLPFLFLVRGGASEKNGNTVFHDVADGKVTWFEIIIDGRMFRMRKFGDPIAETFYLMEMARFIKNEANPLHSSKINQVTYYHLNKNLPVVCSLGDEIRVHKSHNEKETFLTTLDHTNKLALHVSLFKHQEAGERMPFEHETQDVVEKIDHPLLERGYATDMAYLHFLGSKHPLSTSDAQQQGGHEMWKRLANRSHNDGYHVYYWDNHEKKLTHLINKDDVERGLNTYISKQYPSSNPGNLVISKSKIVVDNQ